MISLTNMWRGGGNAPSRGRSGLDGAASAHAGMADVGTVSSGVPGLLTGARTAVGAEVSVCRKLLPHPGLDSAGLIGKHQGEGAVSTGSLRGEGLLRLLHAVTDAAGVAHCLSITECLRGLPDGNLDSLQG